MCDKENNINLINSFISKYNSDIRLENNDHVIYEYENGIKDVVRTISKNTVTLDVLTENNKIVGEYDKNLNSMDENDVDFILQIVDEVEADVEKTLKRISNENF